MLLAEEMDKTAQAFGTYDVVKSKVVTNLKTTIVVKKKEKMVKKIKKKFGVEETSAATEDEKISNDEGDEENDESEKEEEIKEEPTKGKVNIRKAKKPPSPQPKLKKMAKLAPKKLVTRATTRASTQKT